jgi:hypothetical protein
MTQEAAKWEWMAEMMARFLAGRGKKELGIRE